MTRTLQEQYVDPARVDDRWTASVLPFRTAALAAQNDTQFNRAMAELLDTLHDPHTFWLSPEQAAHEHDIMSGSQAKWLGLWILYRPDHLPVVTWVTPHSPAEQAGVHQGDVVLAVGGQACPAPDALAGPAGTSVVLTVQGPQGPARQVTVARRQVSSGVPRQVVRLPGQPWVYLRLDSFFEEGIATDVRQHLDAQVRQGEVQGVIVDLRANSGGALTEAEVLMGAWTDGTFLSSVGRLGDRVDYPGFPYAYDGALGVLPKDVRLAVLVSPTTASAGEMTAAALRVVRHAVLLGQPTAGLHGITQQRTLPNGAILNLTTRRVQLPDQTWLGRGPLLPDVPLLQSPMLPPEADPAVTAAIHVLSSVSFVTPRVQAAAPGISVAPGK